MRLADSRKFWGTPAPLLEEGGSAVFSVIKRGDVLNLPKQPHVASMGNEVDKLMSVAVEVKHPAIVEDAHDALNPFWSSSDIWNCSAAVVLHKKGTALTNVKVLHQYSEDNVEDSGWHLLEILDVCFTTGPFTTGRDKWRIETELGAFQITKWQLGHIAEIGIHASELGLMCRAECRMDSQGPK